MKRSERRYAAAMRAMAQLPVPHNWTVKVTGRYAHILRPKGLPARSQLLVNIDIVSIEGWQAIAHYIAARWYWLFRLCNQKMMLLRNDYMRYQMGIATPGFTRAGYISAMRRLSRFWVVFEDNGDAWMKWVEAKEHKA